MVDTIRICSSISVSWSWLNSFLSFLSAILGDSRCGCVGNQLGSWREPIICHTGGFYSIRDGRMEKRLEIDRSSWECVVRSKYDSESVCNVNEMTELLNFLTNLFQTHRRTQYSHLSKHQLSCKWHSWQRIGRLVMLVKRLFYATQRIV